MGFSLLPVKFDFPNFSLPPIHCVEALFSLSEAASKKRMGTLSHVLMHGRNCPLLRRLGPGRQRRQRQQRQFKRSCCKNKKVAKIEREMTCGNYLLLHLGQVGDALQFHTFSLHLSRSPRTRRWKRWRRRRRGRRRPIL